MTWNDTMGSQVRTQGPAAREVERIEKDKQRQAMEQSNAQDLNELNSYIDEITGFHRAQIPTIDWEGIATRAAPVGTDPAQMQKWQQDQALCQLIRAGDDSALLSVIKGQQRLTGNHKLGRGLGFTVNNGQIHAVLSLHDTSIVPDFQFKYMPSGKLTEAKMPRDRTMALYRAYAYSALLKVASDLIALVGRPDVIVSCLASKSVADSDFDEEWPVLSIRFTRDVVRRLDLPNTDAVKTEKLFEVSEKFHPHHGFAWVVPLAGIPARMAI